MKKIKINTCFRPRHQFDTSVPSHLHSVSRCLGPDLIYCEFSTCLCQEILKCLFFHFSNPYLDTNMETVSTLCVVFTAQCFIGVSVNSSIQSRQNSGRKKYFIPQCKTHDGDYQTCCVGYSSGSGCEGDLRPLAVSMTPFNTST